MSDFEETVLTKLGELSEGQLGMSNGLHVLFKRIEGNGQPGIAQRLTVVENRCSMIQDEKKEKDAAGWGMKAAIIAAIISPIVTVIIERLVK